MKAKLIPPVSPSDNYERTTKGVLSSKKTYVMQTKLNLSPQVIDIMKSQAAQELAREQRDKDDDVLGF